MALLYLDYAATAPLSCEARLAMDACLNAGADSLFGNANSLHSTGRDAFMALEAARSDMMRAIGAGRPDEVVFTSGATEADNTALMGLAFAALDMRRMRGHSPFRPNIIVSAIEHDAVLSTAAFLKRFGIETRYVRVDASGHVVPASFEAAIDTDTLAASIMMANNEVGSVQPIEELVRISHEHDVPFHTDAVQALGKIPVDVSRLGVDAASFSAHKVGGPKGVGVLYLKTRTPFVPFMHGGGQERGLRSGTQNVAGALGASAAMCFASAHQTETARHLTPLRDRLYRELSYLRGVEPSVVVPGDSAQFLPNIVNVCVRGFESETLIMQLDLKGVCVSGGSACSSHSLEPSHVLTALNIPKHLAQGSLRISMGPDTSESHIDAFIEALKEVIS